MKLWGYRLPPMDFGWVHLPEIDDYELNIIEDLRQENDKGEVFYAGDVVDTILKFRTTARAAEKLADEKLGCYAEPRRDGVQGLTHVMCLPPNGGAEPELAFIWKLDNNGDTIVVSTVQLDYLLETADQSHDPVQA